MLDINLLVGMADSYGLGGLHGFLNFLGGPVQIHDLCSIFSCACRRAHVMLYVK